MASSIIFHQPDITRETSEKRIPSFRFVTGDERGGVEKDKLQKVLISNFANRGKQVILPKQHTSSTMHWCNLCKTSRRK